MKGKYQTAIALIVSLCSLWFGFLAFGSLITAIFSAGYVGGFLLWLPSRKKEVRFANIKLPFWATWAAFAFLHKVEENRFKFFEVVSQITNEPVPEVSSPSLIMLLLVGVVPWFFVPYILNRWPQIGSYFAWTFFASMGITELAHFLVFPFLVEGPYSYFPGMASVVVLAPCAWWGMLRLVRQP